MRANYTAEELVALAGLSKLLAGEISRMTQIVIACHKHLVNCESSEHRAQIVARAGSAVSAILNHLRYCAWIEAEVTNGRVFVNPQGVLDEIIAQQEAIAAAVKEQGAAAVQEKPVSTEREQTTEAEQAVAADIAKQAADMDKLANAPSTGTKQ